MNAQEEQSGTYDGPKENLHIYLLIGQSNMAGRAPFTEAEAGVIPRCFLLNDEEKWEPAKNPLNRYSTIRKGLDMQKLNPGYSFSQAMLAQDESISLGLVVNAKGGSNIDEWTRESKYYKEAVRRTQLARATGELKGILWHQGEANARDEQYLEKLQTLVANLRSDFNMQNLPFIAGQVNNTPPLEVNVQIAKLPETTEATGFVSSEGLKAMDRWHFDTESMKTLGLRYAEEMLKVQAKSQDNTGS